jgi:hypothetical protein
MITATIRMAPVNAAPIRTTEIAYNTLAMPHPNAKRLDLINNFGSNAPYTERASGIRASVMTQGIKGFLLVFFLTGRPETQAIVSHGIALVYSKN